MWQLVIKFVVTAALVVAISEAAKRSNVLGGLLASLPLTSLLALSWLYHDTGDVVQVAALSRSIFWFVLPSLVLFLILPVLLEHGLSYWLGITIASVVTALAYGVMVRCLPYFGVTL
jgi:hypothetical protein